MVAALDESGADSHGGVYGGGRPLRFGILMWELLTRERVYDEFTPLQILTMVSEENMRPEIPSWTSADYAKLVRDCWHRDPHKRPSWEVLLRELQLVNFAPHSLGEEDDDAADEGSCPDKPT
eukprot:TRINITY_DN22482_c0_g1_i1.p2 TRINITY_DN22482_c0_g1~~TRINITY_DN22482_c0_g1_i1.p2  ORF type:complete len:122 (+),score=25.88 TRINITY_DN22482_c0_g1_i1:286-651(+)